MSLAIKTEKRQGEAVGFDFDALAVIGLAIVIGVLGGLFAVLFRLMINGAHYGFHALGKTIFGFLKYPLWMIFVPALAGLLVGPLTHFLAREAKGHGVPEVMEAVALRGGFIRMRVIFVKAIASASSIGAGASVGREGPIVQMGSGIGSVLARWCKQSEDRIKTSVGCGAAAPVYRPHSTLLWQVLFLRRK
ncbi:MAG: chloride channel protein [Peptococcaceae bacterium]|jgi:CIC family chloride channel protein|nr:chloride channel protein [Peptococcaceae bacterium]MDH7526213.1 chloride channel protein [Peptococcaceae bacterium]